MKRQSLPGDEVIARVSRLLDRARLRDALRAAEATLHLAPDSAHGHYALGLALTQCERTVEADAAFAQAAALRPTEYFLPYRVEREEFERLAEGVLASLPREFQRHLENVEVAVEDVPSLSLLRDDVGHDTLGLYQGDSIQGSEWGFPDRIVLFRRNLENISPDREALVKETRATVLHEVGHHLGMDEDHLQSIEDGDEGSA